MFQIAASFYFHYLFIFRLYLLPGKLFCHTKKCFCNFMPAFHIEPEFYYCISSELVAHQCFSNAAHKENGRFWGIQKKKIWKFNLKWRNSTFQSWMAFKTIVRPTVDKKWRPNNSCRTLIVCNTSDTVYKKNVGNTSMLLTVTVTVQPQTGLILEQKPRPWFFSNARTKLQLSSILVILWTEKLF